MGRKQQSDSLNGNRIADVVAEPDTKTDTPQAAAKLTTLQRFRAMRDVKGKSQATVTGVDAEGVVHKFRIIGGTSDLSEEGIAKAAATATGCVDAYGTDDKKVTASDPYKGKNAATVAREVYAMPMPQK